MLGYYTSSGLFNSRKLQVETRVKKTSNASVNAWWRTRETRIQRIMQLVRVYLSFKAEINE